MGVAAFNATFIGLDLEATDLSSERGGIIEVGAVRYENGKEVAHFETLIDPGMPIPPIITTITGIREQDVLGKPRFEDVRDELAKFVGDAPIVGHNIQFDIGFLKSQGLALSNQTFDTWRMATMLMPTAASHSLESLAQELKLSHPEAHRAVHDARVGCDLFMFLAQKLKETDAVTAKRLLNLAHNNTFSFREVFEEVFRGGTSPAAQPQKSSGQAQLNFTGTVSEPGELPTPWLPHAEQPGERTSRQESLSVDDLEKLFIKSVKKISVHFELRTPQVELVKELTHSLTGGNQQIIEVASGIGRREAALFASINAKLTKDASPVLYVVGGHYEQERAAAIAESLLDDDQSHFAQTLGTSSSYVDADALLRLSKTNGLSEEESLVISTLLLWIPRSKTGDMSELSPSQEEKMIMESISCIGHTKCVQPEHNSCSYCSALQRAQSASVVIMMQETFTDLRGVDKDMFQKSPVILDDLDRLDKELTKSLGLFVHQASLERDLRMLTEADVEGANSLVEQVTLVAGILGLLIENSADLDVFGGIRQLVLGSTLLTSADYIRSIAALESLVRKLNELPPADKIAASLRVPRIRIEAFAAAIERFLAEDSGDAIRFIQFNDKQKFVLKLQPVSVQEFIPGNVMQAGVATVLMGPRLTVGGSFRFIRERLGVPNEVKENVVAPLPRVKENIKIIAVNDHPDPYQHEWIAATATLAAQAATTLKGRILVLVTNKKSALAVQQIMEDKLKGTGIALFAQGISGGRGKITQKLLAAPHAVLIGTYGFVENRKYAHGFRAVILSRLPFSVPSEPLSAARKERARSGFKDVELPTVALRVREQFDRVIEQPDDRGVLIVLDQKLQKEYANVFIDSLPDAPYVSVPGNELASELAPFA